RIRRTGFVSFLCLLGSHARADVLSDRCLGWDAADLCGAKVCRLYDYRQFAHACRDYLSGDPPCAGGTGPDLRCFEALRLAPAVRSADLAISRVRAVLRDQGAPVSVPYLV